MAEPYLEAEDKSFLMEWQAVKMVDLAEVAVVMLVVAAAEVTLEVAEVLGTQIGVVQMAAAAVFISLVQIKSQG
jgi:hypothetical protein